MENCLFFWRGILSISLELELQIYVDHAECFILHIFCLIRARVRNDKSHFSLWQIEMIFDLLLPSRSVWVKSSENVPESEL
jgi:hypothetical protein